MARVIGSLWKLEYEGRSISVQTAIHHQLFLSWLAPKNASLAFAVCFVLFWYLVLLLLQKRGIVFKV